MGCIDLVRCVLVLCFGLAVVVWYPYAGWGTNQINITHEITQQISRKLLRMDVLTSEKCWALNKEIIKQVASSWSLFTQLPRVLFNSEALRGAPSFHTLDFACIVYIRLFYWFHSVWHSAYVKLCFPLWVHLAMFSFTGNDRFFLCIFTECVLTPVFVLLTCHE